MHLQLFHLTCRRGHLHLGVQDGETAARRNCPGGHSVLPDIRPATLLLRGSEGPGKLCPEPGEFPRPEGPPPPAPGPAPAPETSRAAIPLSPSGRQGAGLLSPGPSALPDVRFLAELSCIEAREARGKVVLVADVCPLCTAPTGGTDVEAHASTQDGNAQAAASHRSGAGTGTRAPSRWGRRALPGSRTPQRWFWGPRRLRDPPVRGPPSLRPDARGSGGLHS